VISRDFDKFNSEISDQPIIFKDQDI